MKWYWWALIFLGVIVLATAWYKRNTSTGINNKGLFNFTRTQTPFEAYNTVRQNLAANRTY